MGARGGLIAESRCSGSTISGGAVKCSSKTILGVYRLNGQGPLTRVLNTWLCLGRTGVPRLKRPLCHLKMRGDRGPAAPPAV